MPPLSLPDFRAALPASARLLGLDVGDKTVGVAVSDPGGMLAAPIETIHRAKFAADAARIAALMQDRGATGLVIGLPVSLDGTEGPRCQSVRQFARTLEKHLGPLTIAFWDERMSTAAVQRMMIEEGDLSRAKRARVIDAHAAAYILQGALDALKNSPRA
jgi:putative Holliday junction resolvase